MSSAPHAAMRISTIGFVTLLAACASVPQPEIDTFASQMEDRLDAAESYLDAQDADDKAFEDKLDVIAERGGFFVQGGDFECAPLRPIVGAIQPRDTLYLRDRCPDSLALGDKATGKTIPLDLNGTPANRLANGRRAIAALRDYSAALGAIVEASEYADVVTHFDAARKAVEKAGEAGSKLPDGEGLPDKLTAASSAGGALAGAVLESALKRVKANALRKLVIPYDPVVTDVTQVVASLLFSYEREEMDTLAGTLEEAYQAQLTAANSPGVGAAERRVALTDYLDAKQAAEEFDEARESLAVLRIGGAHHAIAEAMRAPESVDALIGAQREILDLIEQGEAFEDTLKAL